MKASDVTCMIGELIEIANAVSQAPYDERQAVEDALSGDRIPGREGVRDWAVESKAALSATEGFTHYPLFQIASRRVGGARGWFEGDVLRFARQVATVFRWIASFKITPVEPVQEKFITTLETVLAFNQTESGWSLKVISPIAELYRKFDACLEQADPSRIRSCGNCSRIFYAGRIDQSACSIVCARRLRSRHWYEKKGRKLRGYKTIRGS